MCARRNQSCSWSLDGDPDENPACAQVQGRNPGGTELIQLCGAAGDSAEGCTQTRAPEARRAWQRKKQNKKEKEKEKEKAHTHKCTAACSPTTAQWDNGETHTGSDSHLKPPTHMRHSAKQYGRWRRPCSTLGGSSDNAPWNLGRDSRKARALWPQQGRIRRTQCYKLWTDIVCHVGHVGATTRLRTSPDWLQ